MLAAHHGAPVVVVDNAPQDGRPDRLAAGALDPLCVEMSRSALGTRPGEPGPRVLGLMACAAVVRREA
jgi:hypothetical protein